MGDGLAQPGNLFFQLLDERVEFRNLPGVLPLLVLAEAEQVGLVLGTPAVKVQTVLLDDYLAQFLSLFKGRPFENEVPRQIRMQPSLSIRCLHSLIIDLQRVPPGFKVTSDYKTVRLAVGRRVALRVQWIRKEVQQDFLRREPNEFDEGDLPRGP